MTKRTGKLAAKQAANDADDRAVMMAVSMLQPAAKQAILDACGWPWLRLRASLDRLARARKLAAVGRNVCSRWVVHSSPLHFELLHAAEVRKAQSRKAPRVSSGDAAAVRRVVVKPAVFFAPQGVARSVWEWRP